MNRNITLIEPFFNLAGEKEKIRVRLGFRVGHATMASSTKPHATAPEYYRVYSRPTFSSLPHRWLVFTRWDSHAFVPRRYYRGLKPAPFGAGSLVAIGLRWLRLGCPMGRVGLRRYNLLRILRSLRIP
jgi:hypothetical protein